MYKKKQPTKTSIKVNTSYEGETIEQKIFRILNNGEPISDGAPLIYTDRKDGVQPAYDIRTDRFELAVEGMDRVTKDKLAKREEKAKIVGIDEKTNSKKDEKIGGTEPIAGTDKDQGSTSTK